MTGFQSKRAMARERFGMLYEDPMYDEDGVLVDEDFNPEEPFSPDEGELSPYGTVNS